MLRVRGRAHTAARPDGARPGPVGYGPNLAAFAVYLMVVQFVPAHRVVALLQALTGTVWVPETPHTSRDVLILVEQSTEPVAPSDGVRRARRRLAEWS